jgi:hypothetical protein
MLDFCRTISFFGRHDYGVFGAELVSIKHSFSFSFSKKAGFSIRAFTDTW